MIKVIVRRRLEKFATVFELQHFEGLVFMGYNIMNSPEGYTTPGEQNTKHGFLLSFLSSINETITGFINCLNGNGSQY